MLVKEYPVRMRRGRPWFPPIFVLNKFEKTVAGFKISLTCELPEVKTIYEWSNDVMPKRVALMGRFGWEHLDYMTYREFFGVSAYFADSTDAVHFRLAWNDTYPDMD